MTLKSIEPGYESINLSDLLDKFNSLIASNDEINKKINDFDKKLDRIILEKEIASKSLNQNNIIDINKLLEIIERIKDECLPKSK